MTHKLEKAYGCKAFPFTDLTFGVPLNECLGIIGQNGSGKTCLVNVLSGVVAPNHGRVYINKTKLPRSKRKVRKGYHKNA